MRNAVRPAAVAGRWYPASADTLGTAVAAHLVHADRAPRPDRGHIVGLIAPHAGLMYSGPVAAFAYRLLPRDLDLAVLVGPSHFVAFDGVAVYPVGGFETPFGVVAIDEAVAAALLAASPVMHAMVGAHVREHALEMQLPFLKVVSPGARIVPLLMGEQTAATAAALGDALATVLRDRLPRGRTVVIASTDLSHYHDASTAARLDSVVIDCVSRFDEQGLQRAIAERPEHACGGGPAVAVMRAARQLGATTGVALHYADSGDVSGDKSSVVGYLAAAFVADIESPELTFDEAQVIPSKVEG
jgi:AmmeMemoRadiSam system protein B